MTLPFPSLEMEFQEGLMKYRWALTLNAEESQETLGKYLVHHSNLESKRARY